VTIAGTAATATVTLQTSLNSVSSLHAPAPPPLHRPLGWATSGTLLCGLMLAGARVSRRRRWSIPAALAFLFLLTLVSCANPSPAPPLVSISPKSVTTMVTISATAGTTVHSTQVALTITK
jgi:predicted permease